MCVSVCCTMEHIIDIQAPLVVWSLSLASREEKRREHTHITNKAPEQRAALLNLGLLLGKNINLARLLTVCFGRKLKAGPSEHSGNLTLRATRKLADRSCETLD